MYMDRHARRDGWRTGAPELTSRGRRLLRGRPTPKPHAEGLGELSAGEIDMLAHIFGFRDAHEMIVFAVQLEDKAIRRR